MNWGCNLLNVINTVKSYIGIIGDVMTSEMCFKVYVTTIQVNNLGLRLYVWVVLHSHFSWAG